MADAFIESLVAREIEKAWREGWSCGYSAGLREDTASGTYWCDEEKDWRESEARASITIRETAPSGHQGGLMTKDKSGARPSDQATQASPEAPEGSSPFGECPSRKEKWAAFDAEIHRRQHWDAAPYLVEGAEGSLWMIQYLYRPESPYYGWLRRMLFDPPKLKDIEHEAYYNGWPGDHRGWMKFESKEAALDFFKFSTRQIGIEELGARSRTRPCGPYQRIDLDSRGDPIASGMEARQGGNEVPSEGRQPDGEAETPNPDVTRSLGGG